MTRKDIVKALRDQTSGDFVSRTEVARAMGYKNPHGVDRFLKGLARIGSKYYIEDVAERIAKEVKDG